MAKKTTVACKLQWGNWMRRKELIKSFHVMFDEGIVSNIHVLIENS